jgi:hypothetical protein
MQNKESKRASICQVYFMEIAESTVTDIPGLPQIKVIGDWAKIDYSTVEFAEDKSSDGNSYEVNLSITFSDSSLEKMRELIAWLGIYILVRLDYTDGTSRVVGTDQFPVVLSLSGQGSPRSLIFSYKNQQPELSKIL